VSGSYTEVKRQRFLLLQIQGCFYFSDGCDCVTIILVLWGFQKNSDETCFGLHTHPEKEWSWKYHHSHASVNSPPRVTTAGWKESVKQGFRDRRLMGRTVDFSYLFSDLIRLVRKPIMIKFRRRFLPLHTNSHIVLWSKFQQGLISPIDFTFSSSR